jgi:hypothetical protein
VEDKMNGDGIKYRLLPLGEKEGKWGQFNKDKKYPESFRDATPLKLIKEQMVGQKNKRKRK